MKKAKASTPRGVVVPKGTPIGQFTPRLPGASLRTRGSGHPLRDLSMAMAIAVMLPLAACQGGAGLSTNMLGADSGFRGGVSADEPHAALVGRDVLEGGGNAADAAAAMGLALAVAYPHAAGLGGGGMCVVYDQAKNETASYDFRLRAAAGGGAIGTPGLVRGLSLLQARHGLLEWAKAVAPAEGLARAGLTASRAMVRPLNEAAAVVRADPDLQALLGRADGSLLAEGQDLSQVALATTLAQIRQRGPGEFYQGQVARQYVEAAGKAGGHLSADDMRTYVVAESKGTIVDYGKHQLVLPGVATPGVAVFNNVLAATLDKADAAAPERATLLAKASRAAYAASTKLVAGRDDGSAALAVIDAGGSAVACTLSMGDPLGAGKVSRELGLVLGAAPAGDKGQGGRHMVPALVANLNSKSAYWAGAGATDDAAPVALVQTFLDSMGTKAEELKPAIAGPRLIDVGGGIVYEPGTAVEVADALKGMGERTVEAGPLGRVAAVWCPQGLPGLWRSCRFAADPRGAGLASMARLQK